MVSQRGVRAGGDDAAAYRIETLLQTELHQAGGQLLFRFADGRFAQQAGERTLGHMLCGFQNFKLLRILLSAKRLKDGRGIRKGEHGAALMKGQQQPGLHFRADGDAALCGQMRGEHGDGIVAVAVWNEGKALGQLRFVATFKAGHEQKSVMRGEKEHHGTLGGLLRTGREITVIRRRRNQHGIRLESGHCRSQIVKPRRKRRHHD